MYLKPIISNGTNHELVERNSESLDPNRAPTFQSSPTMAKGQKNQLKVCANNIKQAFIKIKKRNTLESNSLSLAESLLLVQALAIESFLGVFSKNLWEVCLGLGWTTVKGVNGVTT